jgi:Kef-type K+ transport system membrane component KefB
MASLVPPASGRSGAARTALVGTALIALPIALTIGLLAVGSSGRGPALAAPAASGSSNPYPRLLLALPVVLAACHLTGALVRRLGQSAVIGEIIAGVLLGPSLLGAVWPAGFHWLFPSAVISTINTLSQLGLIFFMFLLGLEMDLDKVRRRGVTAATVSQAGVALPMFTGIVLAFWLYPRFGQHVGFLAFALFFAVSMSVTAFPVLARILSDRGIAETPLGALALTCAAVGDVVAWCLLAVVVAIGSHGTAGSVAVTVALATVVRPLMARWLGALPEQAMLPVLLAGVMLSALATSQIGVHPMFGAFAFGVAVPRSVLAARQAAAKTESVTMTLLLPLFFVYTGLNTRFGLIGGSPRLWAWCGVITAVAVFGKFFSATAAARLTGVGWRESLSLGALMNCRGLTELVVLSIGLQLKVISPTVFAMLVIMTLVSTVATAPLLSLIARVRRTPAAAEG